MPTVVASDSRSDPVPSAVAVPAVRPASASTATATLLTRIGISSVLVRSRGVAAPGCDPTGAQAASTGSTDNGSVLVAGWMNGVNPAAVRTVVFAGHARFSGGRVSGAAPALVALPIVGRQSIWEATHEESQ
ncbi:hypothetical protein GCM10018954_095530 [Kutzneria kofuensis]